MTQLPPQYNPKTVEEARYRRWESEGLFQADVDPKRKPYTIVIPPPNITGILHMGHALNNTIQDILIRWRRMQGANALWVPGTDHAGIATQNVVEKALAKEGKRRQDLGREAFVQRVWRWKEEYGNTILYQLKRLGASCDWRRTRFTMDEGLSDAVLEAFVRLYGQGLIYRGNYIINWCPRCQTALADEEAPRTETQGKLYHIRYPLEGRRGVIEVATTRPETMLGDTAVAVHPKDKRYKALIGQHAILPLVNRKLPIIADEAVDREFGTGAVKVTPAHDPVDFRLGKQHDLEFLNVMTDDAKMTNVPKPYEGLDRFDCRSKLIVDLEQQGFLGKIDEHVHNVGHCYRCHTAVEPRLSPQWFVRMKPLAQPAIAAVKRGTITFVPSRWTKVYLNWMEHIQDWCISRQIWWGHRLPVYYCDPCAAKGKGVMVSKTAPSRCPTCGGTELRQDEDVLDTWFSSWLWPFSTLGWPKKSRDLDYFYPTSALVTAQEIIFFWVARMIMAGYFCMNRPPFTQVYIHGTVRDITGKKMSKSLGNIIDPLEVIDQYGTDALRYTLVTATAIGQDVFLSEERFAAGRNFANKLWNAARFLQSTAPEAIQRPLPKPSELTRLEDQWIISRLQRTIDGVTKALDQFRFNEAATRVYDFVWHDVCDWYLELSKTIDLAGEVHQGSAGVSHVVLAHTLSTSLRLLHPLMPFITEELWTWLKPPGSPSSLVRAPWPSPNRRLIHEEAEQRMTQLIAITTAAREIRHEFRLAFQKAPGSNVTVYVSGARSEQEVLQIRRGLERLRPLGRLEIGEVGKRVARPPRSLPIPVDGLEAYVSIPDKVDVSGDLQVFEKKIGLYQQQLRDVAGRLRDKQFLRKAPTEIVEGERAKQAQLELTVKRMRTCLDVFK